MEKITRFRDIPKFTRDGHWQADFDFKNLIDFIDEHIDTDDKNLSIDGYYDVYKTKEFNKENYDLKELLKRADEQQYIEKRRYHLERG